MPSVDTLPAYHPPTTSTPFTFDVPNGTSTINHPHFIAMNTSQLPTPPRPHDGIKEGKEKAKAVMAASTAGAKSMAPQGQPTTMTDTVITNGNAPSRKRSRSGSRRPAAIDGPSKERIPLVTELSRLELDTLLERDNIYLADEHSQREELSSLMDHKRKERDYYQGLMPIRKQQPSQIFGYGYAGFGNGRTDKQPTSLLYPMQKPRAGNRRARRILVKRKDMSDQSDLLEELVPIRLDIEHDKFKLRDTFTWNLHDHVTPTDAFAEALLEDFTIPPEQIPYIIGQVNQKMQEQIQEFYPHVFIEEEPLDPHLPYSAYKNDEMRITIKLHITIGPHTLVDQFEWEINNPLNNPEEFAKNMSRDLSLSGEFTTAIAHQIREQSQLFTKSLYILGHPFDGRPVEDPDVRDSFMPTPLPSVFRPFQAAKEFAPYLFELNESELQREELSILRDQRRQKRSTTRRGGPALPDLKDRDRTVRTLLVSTVIPGAAETIEEARILKVSRSSGRTKRPGAARAEGGDESEESSEEESEVEMEVAQPLAGTARTRGMRGAASAAQVAMRAGFGRSATPESSAVEAHALPPPRTSRRAPLEREESVVEPVSATSSLIVRLRVSPSKLRQVMDGSYARSHSRHLSRQASSMPPPPSPAPPKTPGAVTPAPELPTGYSADSGAYIYHPNGSVDAPYPLPPGQNPPPPAPWLQSAVQTLQRKYPTDSFGPVMQYKPVDKQTLEPIKADSKADSKADQIPGPSSTDPLPPHVRYMWLPRVKCHDCPARAYNPGPGTTVENFEVHLRNRQHKERVEARRKG